MNKIEIIERENSLEDIQAIFRQVSYSIGTDTPILKTGKSPLLTSLVVGACFLSNPSESKGFELKETSDNYIESTFNYHETIGTSISEYINELGSISVNQNTTKHDIIRDILSFKALNNNWDGYGSIPMEIDVASNTISLIDLVGENLFCTIEDYYPNPNGTISLIWENEANEKVSVEVGNNTMSYFVELSSIDVEFINDAKINLEEADRLSRFISVL